MDGGQKDNQKGATGMVNTREYLEAGGGRPSHLCGILQNGSTGSALIWGGDMSPINDNIEAVSGGICGF